MDETADVPVTTNLEALRGSVSYHGCVVAGGLSSGKAGEEVNRVLDGIAAGGPMTVGYWLSLIPDTRKNATIVLLGTVLLSQRQLRAKKALLQ
jgi:hypothetical protein